MKTLLLLTTLALITLTTDAAKIQIKRGVTEIDISTLNATDTIYLLNEFKVGATIGVQIIFKNVTGTPDGTVNALETNDLDELYMQIVSAQLPHTISAANETLGLSKLGEPWEYLIFVVDKNGMTGGTLKFDTNIIQY